MKFMKVKDCYLLCVTLYFMGRREWTTKKDIGNSHDEGLKFEIHL